MNIPTPGANVWDMHFLEPPNMQKISILHCKMEFFCIFSIPRNGYLYPWGKLVGYACSGATKYAKNLHFTL